MRGQPFGLGLVNVVTLWTGWIFSEDEWEIISWYNPKFSPISSQPPEELICIVFFEYTLVCTLHLNAVGPWLPETSTCIPKTIIRPTELAAAAQKPLKWPKICCKSCKMLPNCQPGTKKNDLTTLDTPHKVRTKIDFNFGSFRNWYW